MNDDDVAGRARPPEGASRGRILVVDANAAALHATARLLAQAGHDVAEAESGEAAWAAIDRQQPELVLLDIDLPDLAGLEILRRLRADTTRDHVSVVLVSSDPAFPDPLSDALDTGADGYFVRPIASSELLARVRAHLRQRELTARLRASEARFRAIVEHEPECVKIVSVDGHLRDMNPAGLRMIECEDGREVFGRAVLDLVHPDDRTLFITLHEQASRGHVGQLQFRIIGLKGTERWMETHSVPLYEGGHVTAVLSVTRDVTDRRRDDERLREQAALLDHARDAILVRSLDHRIRYWNRGAERLYGWSAADAVGRSAADLLYRKPAAYHQAVATLLDKGEWIGELEQVTKSGALRNVECRWTLLRDAAGQPTSILAINTDLTERKRLEAQALRSQRMESIGTLAGGIAHDLNNVLTPILMSVDVLRQKSADVESREMLETIQASAQRGADLVRQVLSFARGVEGQRMSVHLGHTLREVQQIVQDTFPRNITVDAAASAELWGVVGDPTQLHQVVLNLAVNARDAMPSGGTLTLRAANRTLTDAESAMAGEARAGPFVQITVADVGTGIPPEIRERMFEPFFTTKDLGKGTGLGLSTTLAIVKSHGGFIDVWSQPGRGTEMRIYLPAAVAAAAHPAAAAAAQSRPRGQGELVLVVDDEKAIQRVVQRTLERFGYRVVAADHGAHAMAIFAERGPEIAAVLTDVSMPVMDGTELIAALKAIDPGVRIAVSSGLSSDDGTAEARASGVDHFIPKPYTTDQLLDTLHALLRGEPA